MKDEVKGKVEEVKGKLTGDRVEEAKGKARQAAGKARRVGTDVKDYLHDEVGHGHDHDEAGGHRNGIRPDESADQG